MFTSNTKMSLKQPDTIVNIKPDFNQQQQQNNFRSNNTNNYRNNSNNNNAKVNTIQIEKKKSNQQFNPYNQPIMETSQHESSQTIQAVRFGGRRYKKAFQTSLSQKKINVTPSLQRQHSSNSIMNSKNSLQNSVLELQSEIKIKQSQKPENIYFQNNLQLQSQYNPHQYQPQKIKNSEQNSINLSKQRQIQLKTPQEQFQSHQQNYKPMQQSCTSQQQHHNIRQQTIQHQQNQQNQQHQQHQQHQQYQQTIQQQKPQSRIFQQYIVEQQQQKNQQYQPKYSNRIFKEQDLSQGLNKQQKQRNQKQYQSKIIEIQQRQLQQQQQFQRKHKQQQQQKKQQLKQKQQQRKKKQNQIQQQEKKKQYQKQKQRQLEQQRQKQFKKQQQKLLQERNQKRNFSQYEIDQMHFAHQQQKSSTNAQQIRSQASQKNMKNKISQQYQTVMPRKQLNQNQTLFQQAYEMSKLEDIRSQNKFEGELSQPKLKKLKPHQKIQKHHSSQYALFQEQAYDKQEPKFAQKKRQKIFASHSPHKRSQIEEKNSKQLIINCNAVQVIPEIKQPILNEQILDRFNCKQVESRFAPKQYYSNLKNQQNQLPKSLQPSKKQNSSKQIAYNQPNSEIDLIKKYDQLMKQHQNTLKKLQLQDSEFIFLKSQLSNQQKKAYNIERNLKSQLSEQEQININQRQQIRKTIQLWRDKVNKLQQQLHLTKQKITNSGDTNFKNNIDDAKFLIVEKQLNDKNNHLIEKQKQIAQYQLQLKKLNSILQILKQQNDQLVYQNKKIEQMKIDLQKQIRSLQNQVKQSSLKVIQKSKQNEQQRIRLNCSSIPSFNSQTMFEKKSNQNMDELGQQNKNLKFETQQAIQQMFRTQINERNTLKDDLNLKLEQNCRLQVENEQLKTQNRSLKQQLNHNNLKNEVNANNINQAQRIKIETLTIQCETQIKQIQALQQRLQIKKKEISDKDKFIQNNLVRMSKKEEIPVLLLQLAQIMKN